MVNEAISAQKRRWQRVDRRGSPDYPINLPVTAAGATATYEVGTSTELVDAEKYSPLDLLEIVNNDSVDLEAKLDCDPSKTYYAPAGTVRKITDKAYRRLDIKNLDTVTATTLGKVRITCCRRPLDADKAARGGKL